MRTIILAAVIALSGCVLDWTPPDFGDDAQADSLVTDAHEPDNEPDALGTWHLGAAGASCTETCDPLGGYDAATSSYAGSSGTTDGCAAVLDALGVDPGPIAVVGATAGAGCLYNTASARRYRILHPDTTADASGAFWRRACACAI